MGLLRWFRKQSKALVLALSLTALTSQACATVPVSSSASDRDYDKLSHQQKALYAKLKKASDLLVAADRLVQLGLLDGYKKMLEDQVIPAYEKTLADIREYIAYLKRMEQHGDDVRFNIKIWERVEKKRHELLQILYEETVRPGTN